MLRKCAPAMTGESTNVSREAGLNWRMPFDSLATGSAVPYFQPAGNLRLGANVMSFAA